MYDKNIRGNMDWYLNQFDLFEKSMNGQIKSPIHKIRRAAINRFSGLGFPTTKNEEWKYTNVAPISEVNFELEKQSVSTRIKKEDIEKYLFDNLKCNLFVFVNGYFSQQLSSLNDASENVIIKNLNQAWQEEDILINYMTKYAPYDEDTFTALNTAFMQDGIFIQIKKDAIINEPIHLLYLTDCEEKPIISQPRNLIIAGSNSQSSIIETYAGFHDNVYFTNIVGEIVLEENAIVDHYKLQTESEKAFHISSTHIYQGKNSSLASYAMSLGGKLVRNNINILIGAEGCESNLNGLYVGNHSQHIDNHTTIDHAKPHSNSNELYKGILDDKARGVFNGKIFVRRDAQKTNAIQSNNNILLSDDATIDTKPQLEIFADDVKCTHGATVGQLDEDAFFYMRARGIDKQKARSLLIYAFASEVIDKIKIDAVREKVFELYTQKLNAIKLE